MNVRILFFTHIITRLLFMIFVKPRSINQIVKHFILVEIEIERLGYYQNLVSIQRTHVSETTPLSYENSAGKK